VSSKGLRSDNKMAAKVGRVTPCAPTYGWHGTAPTE